MKKGLLATTAIAGVSLLAAPSFAGTPIVGDNYEVTISGNLRVEAFGASPDLDTSLGGATGATSDRGFNFFSNESEVKFAAKQTMDNGIQYGFELELLSQTNDATGSDETWGFIDGFFGRIELGDQDDAGDRMFVAGEDAGAGRGGFDGNPFGGLVPTGAAITGNGITSGGDATKVIYFTPRISGFQGGVSYTPDSSVTGSAGADDTAGLEDLISVGANLSQEFGGANVTVAAVGEFGESSAPGTEDHTRFGIGAKVDYAGVSVAAGFQDAGDGGVTTAGSGDNGWIATAGANYSTGPWKVGVTGLFAERDVILAAGAAARPEVQSVIIGAGLDYTVAPGMTVKGGITYFSLDDAVVNAGTGAVDDQDGTSYVLGVTFAF